MCNKMKTNKTRKRAATMTFNGVKREHEIDSEAELYKSVARNSLKIDGLGPLEMFRVCKKKE